MKHVVQVCLYALFVTFVGVLSAWPEYTLVGDDQAIVSVVFSHAGNRIGECRQYSQEELNELPPNMRKPADCPRERHPVRVMLKSGNDQLYDETLLPSGIWADGKASIYRRIEVVAGVHELFVGMNDSGSEGFDYTSSITIALKPARNLVIQFDEEAREFLIR